VAKPKFTPDPPPAGGSSEEQIAWAQRQYARIEDWWPKDLEDRLKALELSFPYKSGTWPIVDGSSFNVAALSATLFSLNCGEGTKFEYTGYSDASSNAAALTIHNDKLILSKRGTGSGNDSKFLLFDIATETWSELSSGTGTETVAHIAGSPSGSFGVNDRVYTIRNLAGGTSWRIESRMSSDWTLNYGYSVSSSNLRLYTEGLNRLIMRRNSGFLSTYLKSNGTDNRSISDPANHDYSLAMWSESEEKWAVVYYDTSNIRWGVSFVSEGLNGTASAPSSYWDLSASGADDLTFNVEHTIDGDGRFYLIVGSTDLKNYYGSSSTAFIFQLNADGSLNNIWSVEDTGANFAYGASGLVGTAGGLQYFPEANRVVTTSGGGVAQYDPATDTWSSCTVSGVDVISQFGVLDSNNFMWGANDDGTPTVWRHEIY